VQKPQNYFATSGAAVKAPKKLLPAILHVTTLIWKIIQEKLPPSECWEQDKYSIILLREI
jgi:hypothetical protein